MPPVEIDIYRYVRFDNTITQAPTNLYFKDKEDENSEQRDKVYTLSSRGE